MDISKEYIEMCEKAHEIQQNRDFQNGDFMFIFKTNNNYVTLGVGIYSECDDGYYSIEDTINTVWLPRQDQLQEILDKTDSYSFTIGLGCLWDDGVGYSKSDEEEMTYYEGFNSFEKKWLAYVMKEKFNKVWNINIKNWETIL